MKSLLILSVFLASMNSFAGEGVSNVQDITRDLAKIRCYSTFERAVNERVIGSKKSRQNQLAMAVSFFDEAQNSMLGIFTITSAISYDENNVSAKTINASGDQGSLVISISEDNSAEIWVNSVKQDYLKFECDIVLAN